MKRRAFFGIGILGVVGAGTCSWWGSRELEPPDLVRLTSQQTRRFVPAEVGTELWAVLRVAVDEDDGCEPPPVHVGLVIDTSASMAGDPIAAAREAAIELVGSLRDGDRLSLVTFDSRATLVVPNVEIDDDARDEAIEAIDAIEARGTTDLGAGLQTALDDLVPHVTAGRVTRVVLLSDGVPNDSSMVPSAIAQASAMGITVTALGFGLDYDETLLSSISQQTGGTFQFLEQPEDLVPMFREENRRLQGIAAQSMTLSLTTGPNVQLMEVVGQSFAMPTSQLHLGLGDLSRGEERVVVVRLSVGPHREGSMVELLDGALTYHDPLTGTMLDDHAVFLSAEATVDEQALAETVDPSIDREIERARAAALTLHAVALTRGGDQAAAYDVIINAIPEAEAAAERLEDEALVQQAKEMNALAEVLDTETTRELDAKHIEDGRWGTDASEAWARDGEALDPMQGSIGGVQGGGGQGGEVLSGLGGMAGKKPAPRPAKADAYRQKTLRTAHGNAMSNFQARRNTAESR